MKNIGFLLYKRLKKTYENVYTNKVKEDRFNYQIELDTGEPINIKGFSSSSQQRNSLKEKVNVYKAASLIFIRQFQRIGIVIYYITMILHFSIISINLDDFIVFEVPIFIHYVLQCFKAIYYDYQQLQSLEEANKRSVTKFRRFRKELSAPAKKQAIIIKSQQQIQIEPRLEPYRKGNTVISSVKKREKFQLYESTTWDQLDVGDIIYLKRYESSPADILVLDVSNDIVQINCQHLTGCTVDQQRQPTTLTRLKNSKHKLSGFDYKKMLTGQIKYDRDSDSLIKGFIKLKKDPKGEYFDKQNIIFREEQLKSCQYIIGVVLFSGKNCRCFKNSQQSTKQSFFVQKSRMFFALTFLICIILTLANWLLSSFNTCSGINQSNFSTQMLIYYLTLYLKTLPIYFYICVDLIELGNSHYKLRQHRVNQQESLYPKRSTVDYSDVIMPKEPQNIYYSQINAGSIGDMVMTEYVCFDKTGTLTNGQFQVKAILIEDVMFKFDQKQLAKNSWNIYKENFLQQLKENPNLRIAEVEESSDEQPEEQKQVRHTGIFKMHISGPSCRNSMIRTPKGREIEMEEQKGLLKQSFHSHDNSVKQSFIQLEENIMENLKAEDLDDTHCRVTADLKANKPKPFFNKSINANNYTVQSAVQSPAEEFRQIGGFREESKSLQSDKIVKPRTDSSATKNKGMMEESHKFKRQTSNKKISAVDREREIQEEMQLEFLKDQDFFQKLQFGSQQTIYQESLLAMLICQEVSTRYNGTEDIFVNDSTQINLDHELCKFAAYFDIRFICANENAGKIVYIIEINNETHEFQILAINPERDKHPRLGILVQFPERLAEDFGCQNDDSPSPTGTKTETAMMASMLIVREDSNGMPSNVDMDKQSREYWDKVLTRLHMSGMRTIVYSKVYLKDKDRNDYLDRYSILRYQDQAELIELFNQVEKDMQIIQVVGVKEILRPQIKQAISSFKQADLSLYMLSGDEMNRVIPVAFKSGILNETDQLISLDFDQEHNIRLALRNQLAAMAQQIKSNSNTKPIRLNTSMFRSAVSNNDFDNISRDTVKSKSRKNSKLQLPFGEIKAFSILLSGEAFSIILSDQNIYAHFCFVLYFCNSLIAYRLDGQQKAGLVEIVQKQFQGNKRVIAIGDSFNDAAMFLQANFGVQFTYKIPLSQINERSVNRKRLTQRLSYLNSAKFLENPLKKTHIVRQLSKISTADLIIDQFDALCGLMFFESRVFAEVYDDLLVFSFYRSLLIIYVLFLLNSTGCSENVEFFRGSWLTVYQGFVLFVQQIASLVSKLSIQYTGDTKMRREQFKSNIKIFKKKKVLTFVFNINGNAMLDAVLLWVSLNLIQANNDEESLTQQAFLIMLFASDIIKLVVNSQFSKNVWISLIGSYFVCWLLLSLLFTINNYSLPVESFLYLFIQPQVLFALIFNLIMQYCSSKSIEMIKPLFCQSIITDELQYNSIQSIENSYRRGNIQHKKYHNLIKRIAVIAGKLFKKHKDEMDISIQDMVQGSNLKVNQDKVNPFSLRFMNKDTEMKFKRIAKIAWLRTERFKLIIFLLSLELVALMLYIFYSLDNLQADLFIIVYILSIASQFLLFIAIFSSIYSKHFFLINTIILILRFSTKIIMDFNYTDMNGLFLILLTQSYIVVILFSRTHVPILNFILVILLSVGFLIKYTSLPQAYLTFSAYQILNADIIMIATLILFMSLQYKLIRIERDNFMIAVVLNQETAQMNNVLSILLPKFIRDRINAQGIFEISENQGDVAILFCDLCNFDKLVAIEKESIVNLLDNLFRSFDALCIQNGMQKVETVGKTYMAAGGMKAVDQGSKHQNIHPVRRAVNLAVEMQEYVKKFKFGQVGKLTIKIGIHYGKVIAGVIGHHKPQFSLIGDTVNTTSRVCSTGQDGMTTLSSQAYDEITMPELGFIQIKVQAKGKGELITYQIQSQLQRGANKKVKKRGGFILPNEERTNLSNQTSTHKILHQNSIQMVQFGDNDNSSKSIIVAEQAEVRQRQRRTNKGPTLLLRNFSQSSAPPVQHSGFKPGSYHNIQFQEPIQEGSQSQLQQFKDDSFTDKQNLLVEMSQRLRRDIQFEVIDENPEFEVEAEKVKLQFDDDTAQQSGEGLQLEKSKLYLGFKDSQRELTKEFNSYNTDGGSILFISVYLHLCQYFIKTITLFMVIEFNYLQYPTFVLILRLFATFLLFILALLQNKRLKYKYYKGRYFVIVYLILLLGIFVEFILIQNADAFEMQASEGILLICFLCSFSIIKIKYKVYFLILFAIVQIIIVLTKFNDWAVAYYTVFQSLLMFFVQYSLFIQDLNTFNNKKSLENKKQQSGNLVKYLLPSHVLKQFLSNTQRIVLTDVFENATLLFADIAGFTEYSSRVEPEQVVNMLRNLFTEFDKSCLLRNNYKLYTIGDCYVAIGIVDVVARNPAQEAKNIVDLGFLMIDIIQSVRQIIGFDGLDMRIGIHTGKIIGGILGTEIVRYDVYGADVMISNKMESNGEKGKIQVSEETKQLLETQFPYDYSFTFNKSIEFNSINRKTNGYFIEQVKNDSNEAFDNLEFQNNPMDKSGSQEENPVPGSFR